MFEDNDVLIKINLRPQNIRKFAFPRRDVIGANEQRLERRGQLCQDFPVTGNIQKAGSDIAPLVCHWDVRYRSHLRRCLSHHPVFQCGSEIRKFPIHRRGGNVLFPFRPMFREVRCLEAIRFSSAEHGTDIGVQSLFDGLDILSPLQRRALFRLRSRKPLMFAPAF